MAAESSAAESSAAAALDTHTSEEEHIPVEENDSDIDSGFASDAASSTTSMTESIRDYRNIHGRTYHNYQGATYWGPNDEAANESLDIGHHTFTLLLDDRLYLAPIGDNPQKVLDVGTGTGIWAIDFADQFPSADVSATDISPIQPSFVPPNLRFEIDDAQLEWTQAPNSFDFIHMRLLFGSIADWPKLYSEAFRAIKPGGWFQDLEMDVHIKSDDGTIGPGHVLFDWATPFFEAGEQIGKTFDVVGKTKGWMTDAGFVNVTEKKYKIPLGGWSSDPKLKEVGRWNLLQCIQGLEGYALFVFTTILKWPYDHIQIHLARVRAALLDKRNHGYYNVSVVYGQKPLAIDSPVERSP